MSRYLLPELAKTLEEFHITEEGQSLEPEELVTISQVSKTDVELVYNAYKLGYLKGADLLRLP